MAKAVFFSYPHYGHVNPSLSLVEALVDRGEEVVYYSTDKFEEKIKSTGAQYRAYRSEFVVQCRDFPETYENQGNAMHFAYLLACAVRELLCEELENIRSLQPAYIIHDTLASWGGSIAQALQVPAVALNPFFAFNRKVISMGRDWDARTKKLRKLFSMAPYALRTLRVGRQLSKKFGIDDPKIVKLFLAYQPLTIVCTSRYFQPFEQQFGKDFVFCGPAIDEGYEEVDFPWEQVREGKLVYVSIGTTFNRRLSFFRTCFEALASFDGQVVVSTGKGLEPEDLGTAPSNFIVRSFVPQLEVLQRADALVTHGGIGTLSKGLHHGVPAVVAPQIMEQAIVGQRVEDLGAGVSLKSNEVTPESLRAAVEKVVSDGEFRRNSQRIGDSFRSTGGVEKALEEITAYVL